jgi:hypothetical protein
MGFYEILSLTSIYFGFNFCLVQFSHGCIWAALIFDESTIGGYNSDL